MVQRWAAGGVSEALDEVILGGVGEVVQVPRLAGLGVAEGFVEGRFVVEALACGAGHDVDGERGRVVVTGLPAAREPLLLYSVWSVLRRATEPLVQQLLVQRC